MNGQGFVIPVCMKAKQVPISSFKIFDFEGLSPTISSSLRKPPPQSTSTTDPAAKYRDVQTPPQARQDIE